MDEPTTLLEAVLRFSTPKAAHDYFTAVRWPFGVACPRMGCGSADVRFVSTRLLWFCKDCKRQFTGKVGTIFEDSPIPLTKWLPAVWLLSANRNGISSCEVARALGVTQKTAWFMLHRIRLAMQAETFEQLSGEVEVDETFVGPKARSFNRRNQSFTGKRNSATGRATVLGMRERGGKVRAWVVKNNRTQSLLPRVWNNVLPGSTVYTDALKSYHLLKHDYVHEIINHAETYVQGRVHTNSIENFWSVLKRTLGGTYICPRPKHLDAYLDEQLFRFNERENTDGPRFKAALKGADCKRLTYKALKARETI
jgi:transposase-like protein